MSVQIDQPMWEGRYELKSSSYDLAVDIELNDIVQRMRFEHPKLKPYWFPVPTTKSFVQEPIFQC